MRSYQSVRNTGDRQPRLQLKTWFLLAALMVLAAGGVIEMWLLPTVEARIHTRHTFYGPAKTIGAGSVRSYIELKDGVPVEIGVAFTKDALRGLPAGQHHPEMSGHASMSENLLDLPEQAKVTPFTFVELDWNPLGHEPAGIYDRPHFDFHFYTITRAERDAIDPADPDYMRKANNLPDAQLVPATYMAPPPITPVPHMGLHWVSSQADELNGKPFTQTFIQGSWNGRMVFFEPMVTKAFLESRPDITLPIATARCYDPAGYYPTSYRIRYQPDGEYRIALTDFAHRGCETPGKNVAANGEPTIRK